DMAHSFATHLGMSNLNPAAVADDTFVANGLELTAVTFPFLRCAEYPLAEQPVLFGTECPVVDCLRLLHLAVAPRPDLIRRGQFYHNTVEILNFPHASSLMDHSHTCRRLWRRGYL